MWFSSFLENAFVGRVNRRMCKFMIVALGDGENFFNVIQIGQEALAERQSACSEGRSRLRVFSGHTTLFYLDGFAIGTQSHSSR